MEDKRPLQSIPDDELLRRLAELMSQSRLAEADIVAHIAEVDERRLYAREAFPSMFVYCMDVLHLSEAEAYLRILAGRASRAHPMLLTMLADGRLHLTAIVKLAPHLTRENRDNLLERAKYRSKRQILELIAEIAPRPDVPVVVPKLPEWRTQPAAGRVAAPNRGEGRMLELGRTRPSNSVRTQLEQSSQGFRGTEPKSAPTRHIHASLPRPLLRHRLQPFPRRQYRPRWSSPCHLAVTRCSSRPAQSSTASCSDSER